MSTITQRTNARLAAVQAAYLAVRNSGTATAAADTALALLGCVAIAEDEYGEETFVDLPAPDKKTFARLLSLVDENQAALDAVIDANLSEKWPAARLPPLLRGLLRVAGAEILHCPETPAKVAINEYVGIAKSFFSSTEPRMVNAVLDKIARLTRPADQAPAEPAAPSPSPEAESAWV
ncbi:N utilization substance protein B [Alphaproteobacteria bacterium]|nr:N utilization substance protein B [Alphaproteobacteria bacterium]